MRLGRARIAAALVAALLTVLLAGLTEAERERISVLEMLAREALRPVLVTLAEAGQALSGTVRTLVSLPEIRQRQAALEREAARVADLERRLEALEEENLRLRLLLGCSSSSPLPLAGARVVGRNGDSWLSRALIDSGTESGVRKDAAVLTERGLVGRVSSAGPRLSVVTLITDPGSAVGVLVPRTGDAGICYGQVGTQLLRMRFFSREARVSPGDAVVTSGLGGVFPPQLLVGTVVEAFPGDYGLVQYATVRPAVDMDRLWQVMVVRQP